MKAIKKVIAALLTVVIALPLVAFGYEAQYEFSEGIAVVKDSGKFGYVTKDGIELVPCKYDYAFDFADGMANVVMDGKCGYVNTSGVLVIPCEYDGAADFSRGVAAVQKNDKWAFINKEGQLITGFIYNSVGFFTDGFALVEVSGCYGYINLYGQEVVPCMYDEANARVALGSVSKHQPADKYSVSPSSSAVTVDGIQKQLDAYEIKDYNYVKLRSLADALSGSNAPISVDWDENARAVIINFLPAGTVSEGMSTPQTAQDITVYTTTANIIYNGVPVTLDGYNINDNNYFKLRDITQLLGIEVLWNEATATAEIITK